LVAADAPAVQQSPIPLRGAPVSSGSAGRHGGMTSRKGLVPTEPDDDRLVALLEWGTPWDS
jgi:hypothetical protein